MNKLPTWKTPFLSRIRKSNKSNCLGGNKIQVVTAMTMKMKNNISNKREITKEGEMSIENHINVLKMAVRKHIRQIQLVETMKDSSTAL